jgi:predicted ArsR family transcriptional regulator
MNNITLNTRQLSFEDIQEKKKRRYEIIMDRLLTGPKTAKEIAVELYELGLTTTAERNQTAPRLTELSEMGLVEAVYKKKCDWTGKTVALYELTPKGLEQRFNKHIPRID